MLREIGRSLGQRWQLFTDVDKWSTSSAEARVTYGTGSPGRKALSLPAHPFLSGGHPDPADLKCVVVESITMFFPINTVDQPTRYDLLACIFYMLSRYEEYHYSRRDDHDRFPATASHAYRYEYLRVPLVRYHCLWLYDRLRQVFPDLPASQTPPYYFQPTYDVDLPWAYHHRGWRGLASGVKDFVTGRFSRTLSRISTPSATDPYNNLNRLVALHEDDGPGRRGKKATNRPNGNKNRQLYRKPIIFWLLADNTDRHDVNPYPIPNELTEMMLALGDRAAHGLHPGYLTATDATVLQTEVNRYGRITGRKPTISRQHFLRFRLPGSYRNLHRTGITTDHTMGYADAIGWRAGTNLPFSWYDVEREAATYFTVHPFAAMDVTLKNYLGLPPQGAMAEVLALAAPIREVGGPFTLLWHNSSFAVEHGWGGWEEMYYELVDQLQSTI